MTVDDPQAFLNPVTFATPVFVLLVLAEMIYGRLTGRVRFEPRDTASSLLMGLGSTIIPALTGAIVFGLGFWIWENHRLMDIPQTWWAVVIAFILGDLKYYWFHRFSHRIRWFWASHVIHHSSQHYNLSTALRQTWSSFFSATWIFGLPLFWIGFDPYLMAFVGGLNLIYQFWIHTEAIDRLPRWFEAVFNTPSHHRVHHATNPEYLDANYAGTRIIWDRLFGTFVAEDDRIPIRYGLVQQLGTYNPLKIATHEWIGIARDLARTRSLRGFLGYSFGPPGWSEDGSRKTSDMIKQAWARRQVDHNAPHAQPQSNGSAPEPAE